jgi:hypothetical protein
MLALRFVFTAAVMVSAVWLLRTGNPVGGLVVVPLLAISVRRAAESGRLTQYAARVVKRPF